MKILFAVLVTIGLSAHFSVSRACQSPVGYWDSVGDQFGSSELIFHPGGKGAFNYDEEGPRSEHFSWKIISPQMRKVTRPAEYSVETNVVELTYYYEGADRQVSSIEYVLCNGDQMVGLIFALEHDIYRYKKRLVKLSDNR